jgi:hypothetical protein
MARRRRKPCRNCPEPVQPSQQAANNAASKLASARLDPQIVSMAGEGDRLWRHVCFGTGTCIGMLEGYAALNVPGDPLPQLYSLAARLAGVIQNIERRNEDSTPKDGGPDAQGDVHDPEGRLEREDDPGQG